MEYIYHSGESAKSLGYTEKSEKDVSFSTPFGTFEWLGLPQGIMPTTATDIFQCLMVSVFAFMRKQKPNPYLDDILHQKEKILMSIYKYFLKSYFIYFKLVCK